MERVVRWTVEGPRDTEVVQVEVSQNGGNCVVAMRRYWRGWETGSLTHTVTGLGEAGDRAAGTAQHRGTVLGRHLIEGVALITGTPIREAH